jgi:hypothetical protein
VWTVNTTVDDDFTALTLRCALLYANQRDTIRFDPAVFPPAAPATIRLTAALPVLDQTEITIDGSGAGVIIDGSNLPAETSGLVIRSNGNRIAHLQIVNMPRDGIAIDGNDNVIGATLPPLSVVIPDISGPPPAPVNLISGNGNAGVRIDGHRNHVLGNYIGTTASGLAAQPNGVGVLLVGGRANRIGDGADDHGNLISGNRTSGVEVHGDLTQNNRIEGNYVGTNVTGNGVLANQGEGILLHSGANSNLVGSDHSGSGNLISGNGFSGIRAESVLSLTVQANYIGVDLQGAVALPNAQQGILLRDSSYATIGGPRTATGNHCNGGCNLIAGNSQIGLVITGQQSRENLVQANFIGADVSGSKAVANGGNGVWLAEGASHNTLTGNLISGNQSSGLKISGEASEQNKVFGNIIGMDLALLLALGNEVGIRIEQNAHHNIVGGIAPGEANTIAGNRTHGVYLHGSETAFNQIARNFIGLTEAGLEYIGGNGGNGVFLEAGAHDNLVGYDSGGYLGNVIGFNRGHGIEFNTAYNNQILSNSIGRNREQANFGNFRNGVLLRNSASNNIIHGNIIGHNRETGLGIESGSQNNVVGRSGFNGSDYNIIAANLIHGIHLYGGGVTGNQFINNRIGTDGNAADGLGNTLIGIYLQEGTSNTTITENHIVNSTTAAIAVDGADDNRISRNWLGVALDFAEAPVSRGNQGHGVYLLNGADRNRISSNTISANRGNGVRVETEQIGQTIGNTISANSIYSNTLEGIYLNLGNRHLPAPAVEDIDDDGAGHWQVVGESCANCTIELFYDQDTEGQDYVDSVAAGADGRFNITLVAPPDGWNLTLTATDGEGNTSEFSVPYPAPFARLVADAVEVTQAIQTLTEDGELTFVPLIAGKRTAVRFHVHSAEEPVPGITARLTAFRNGVRLEDADFRPLAGPITVLPDPDRGVANQSFTWVIPQEWASGEVEFVLEVNPDRTLHELDYADNSRRKVVSFRQEGPLCVSMVRVKTNPQTASINDPDFPLIMTRVQELLPVPRIRVSKGGSVFEDDGPWELPGDGKKLLRALWVHNLETSDPAACDDHAYYYGMVHPSHNPTATGGQQYAGRGYTPGDEAWGFMNTEARGTAWYAPSGAAIMAHELGHNFGREHIRCGVTSGSLDPYPYLDENNEPCLLGPVREDGYYGYSISAGVAIGPRAASDIMGYRQPHWISDYNYRNFLRLMITPAQRAAVPTALTLTADTELVIATGTISPTTGVATFDAIYRRPAASLDRQKVMRTAQRQMARGATAATYTLQLRNAAGVVVAEQPFQTIHASDDHASTETDEVFQVVMNAHPDMAQVVLLQGSTELVKRTVSQHAPTVQVLAPNGGETVAGPLTIQWQATDQDGDALTYNVQYSPDNGQRWHSLAVGLAANSFTADYADLSGSAGQALIRVTAADGVNTGADQSDAPFSVRGQQPEVMLQAIAAQSVYTLGQTVIFQGWAFDAEDSTLDESAFRWTSSLDGDLGSGSELFTAALSKGVHTITLTVTDSDGQTGQAAATVAVETTPTGQPDTTQLYLPLITKMP